MCWCWRGQHAHARHPPEEQGEGAIGTSQMPVNLARGIGIPMCEWPAVAEWLSQQRAEAEARVRAWELFGPQPSPARIEEVKHWLDERR
jgi:hypothetical protein